MTATADEKQEPKEFYDPVSKITYNERVTLKVYSKQPKGFIYLNPAQLWAVRRDVKGTTVFSVHTDGNAVTTVPVPKSIIIDAKGNEYEVTEVSGASTVVVKLLKKAEDKKP